MRFKGNTKNQLVSIEKAALIDYNSFLIGDDCEFLSYFPLRINIKHALKVHFESDC